MIAYCSCLAEVHPLVFHHQTADSARQHAFYARQISPKTITVKGQCDTINTVQTLSLDVPVDKAWLGSSDGYNNGKVILNDDGG